jgi:hypothetical protein
MFYALSYSRTARSPRFLAKVLYVHQSGDKCSDMRHERGSESMTSTFNLLNAEKAEGHRLRWRHGRFRRVILRVAGNLRSMNTSAIRVSLIGAAIFFRV